MENNTILRQRMYSFVIYQLSGIQAGIQAGHATEQFIEEWKHLPELEARIKDKTVIILNGGTTNQVGFAAYSAGKYTGTLDMYYQTLLDLGIPASGFYEPDLNNALTAVSFLVDERVWDKEMYPDPDIRELRKKFEYYIENKPNKEILFKSDGDLAEDYFSELFGANNRNIARLRMFLKDKKLANN